MTIYYNARFLSPDREYSWIEVGDDGRISGTGDGEAPADDRRVDLGGRLVLPGFIDSHIHVYSLGRAKSRLDLSGARSIEEMRELLREYSQRFGDLPWIVGFGWNQEELKERRYPTRDDIDDVVPDRPVVLFRACHHIGLLNTRALSVIGIGEGSEIEGGTIDQEDGTLTGILREKALALVTPYIEGDVSEETKQKYIRTGLDECLRYGITSVQTNDPRAVEAYKTLNMSGQLPIRVFLTIPYKEAIGEEVLPEQVSDNLHIERVKIFADGSLGASTAALRQPYSDQPENRGILLHSDEELEEMIRKVSDRGWRVEIHAIGDAAAEQVTRTFEKLGLDRPVLTHAQILADDIIERMRGTDIIANIQPVFLVTDRHFADQRVGERIKFSYAWRTLWEKGVALAGGSDAPIESPDPLMGMYCTIFRKGREEEQPWHGEQAMGFQEALELYTRGGAFAAGKENDIGRLEVGHFADFIVVSHDIDKDPRTLLRARVEEVYVGGKRMC